MDLSFKNTTNSKKIKRFRDISPQPLFAFAKVIPSAIKRLSWREKMRRALFLVPFCGALLFLSAILVCFQTFGKQKAPEFINMSERSDIKNLVVVNHKISMRPDFKPNLIDFLGVKVDKAAKKSLEEMHTSASIEGIDLCPLEGFVSAKELDRRHNERVAKLISGGYSQICAEGMAMKERPPANFSEEQTGLLVKFSENAKVSDWLSKNAAKFGFAIRYPDGKSQKTGRPGCPYVYRYVGPYVAEKLRSLRMCLEEYFTYEKIKLSN